MGLLVRSLPFLLILVSCGGTDLGGGLAVTPDGEPLAVDLNLIHTADGDFLGTNTSTAVSSGSVLLNRQIVGETGSLNLSNDIDAGTFASLAFRNTYTSPVVVAYITSRNDSDAQDVRIRNITSTGCEIFYEDPLNNGTLGEDVSYIVMESGRHTFASGLEIEAGSHATTNTHISGAAFTGDVVNFSSAFGGTPVVLHSLNTYNNGDFMSSVVDTAAVGQFTVSQESAQTGNPSVSETIGWVAFSTGNGSINGAPYEIGTEDDGSNDGIGEVAQTFTFTSFSALPDLVVKANSGGGIDGYWTRSAGVFTPTSHSSYAEEDTIGDSETDHANEAFVYAAFEASAGIGVFPASGQYVSPDISLSAVKTVSSSLISWVETSATGASLTLETNVSLDNGVTWLG